MASTDEISQLIAEWRSGVSEQAQRFDATRRAIDEVSVTESAAGGAIMLTVGSSGIPTDLRLGEDVGRMKPDQVAAQIMACLRRAQARLADQVSVVVTDTMGDAAGADAVADEYRYRFPPLAEVDEVPLAPLEENANFGLSDIDTELAATQAPAPPPPANVQPAVPAGTQHRAPARKHDEDEEWETPW
ncbi:YbaB/EbfC family nucleoid-associated protein [Actinophytocola sediminis]